MKSYHIITFGCQMNEHDSERMAGLLEAQGYRRAATPAEAGMVVLNTCSIREKAEQKFYSELGRLQGLKQENPGMRIAVAGCIAQQEGKKILSRAPYVDAVIGPSDIPKLALATGRPTARRMVETAGDPEYHRLALPSVRAEGVKAWISIMYGCDNFCTYCVVPYLRGRERSRPPKDIVDEARALARRGYKEITLLGQNVNSYGRGLDEGMGFPGLLGLLNDVPGIERIRFVTSHPRDLSDELIAAMRDLPKVCESLHLPLQSGSDRILSLMNRRYTAAEYLDKVRRLREAVPDVTLTTDIIAGFPGESEEEFAETLRVLDAADYDGIFAFKYSKRSGTAALKLEGHLPEKVKETRLEAVLARQREATLRKNQALVGTVREVLVDGRSKKGGTMTGRTRGNKAVNFSGAEAQIGTLLSLRITAAGPNSLIGEVCE